MAPTCPGERAHASAFISVFFYSFISFFWLKKQPNGVTKQKNLLIHIFLGSENKLNLHPEIFPDVFLFFCLNVFHPILITVFVFTVYFYSFFAEPDRNKTFISLLQSNFCLFVTYWSHSRVLGLGLNKKNKTFEYKNRSVRFASDNTCRAGGDFLYFIQMCGGVLTSPSNGLGCLRLHVIYP